MTNQNTADHDLGTSAGGRAYVAEYFATQLRRHDFARYIENTLAADFACALAQHLSKLRAAVVTPSARDAREGALLNVLPFLEDMAECETCKGCYKPGVLAAAVRNIRAATAAQRGTGGALSV